MRSAIQFLKRTVDVRSGEGARLILMSLYLLLIITCYTVTKAVRDSLFVTHIGAAQLPYVYVLIAVVMGLVSMAYSRAVNRFGIYALIRLTSLVSITSLVLFWWSFRPDRAGLFYALYVWVSIFGAITASQAWLLANNVFDPREAKRMFTWVALGGILGGIFGGSMTRLVADRLGTPALLLACAAMMGVTLAILQRIRQLQRTNQKEEAPTPSRPRKTEDKQPSGAALRRVLQSRHLTTMVILMSLAVIVEAFVDYEYKFVAKGAFSSQDRLTAFFGTISAYIGILSLLFQVLITNRVLKRFGVGVAILFLPLGLLAVSLVLSAWPVLWAAAALQLVDGGLSYSIHRSGTELLYLPIPAETKNAVKGFIDMFVDRLGRAVGGVILLLLTTVLSVSIADLSLVTSGFLVLWIVAGIGVRKEYLRSFRLALLRKTIEPEALEVGIPDHGTVAALTGALTSADDRQVRYALDLLASVPLSRWRYHLPPLLQHASAAVRARAIGVAAKWKESRLASLVANQLSDPDFKVRAEAIHYLCMRDQDPASSLRRFLRHADYRVVHSAVHAMAEYSMPYTDCLDDEFIRRALTSGDAHAHEARIAAAQALGMVWNGSTEQREALDRLLDDPSPSVVRQAIRTAGLARYENATEFLIRKLADRRFRRVAREALLSFGPSMVELLAQRLVDSRTGASLRVRIPKVLAYTGEQAAADTLLQNLHGLGYHIDEHLVKALSKMRAGFPDLVFQRETIVRLLLQEQEEFKRLQASQTVLSQHFSAGDGAQGILLQALQERLAQRIERIFRLVGLLYPPQDIYAAYCSFVAKPEKRAHAIEFLDNLLDPDLKEVVIPLLEDDATPAEGEEGEKEPVAPVLAQLIEGSDPWLQTIAIELAGRLRLHELTTAVEGTAKSADPFVSETAEWTLRSMSQPDVVGR